jgi:hypothetical protein
MIWILHLLLWSAIAGRVFEVDAVTFDVEFAIYVTGISVCHYLIEINKTLKERK